MWCPARRPSAPITPTMSRYGARSVFPGVGLEVGQKVLPSFLPFPPEYPLTIKEVQEESVVLDLNHPLTDQDLYYEVRVVEVRDTAPEELAVLKSCHSCREGTE